MELTGINQLVSDITKIRVKTELLYLAMILDGYSRKVMNWAGAGHYGAAPAARQG